MVMVVVAVAMVAVVVVVVVVVVMVAEQGASGLRESRQSYTTKLISLPSRNEQAPSIG